MGAYTKEELQRIYLMRRQERADDDRRREQWNAAPVGWTEDETVYVIEYRIGVGETWNGCSPFFDPLSTSPEETHSRHIAEDVAQELLDGKRGPNKTADPADRDITAVRIIERVSTAKIISMVRK